MSNREANLKKFNEAEAFLKAIGLDTVATFISHVYEFGMYDESKVYSATVKRHVKKVDDEIMKRVCKLRYEGPDLNYAAKKLAQLGKIREDLDGHFWRAERIVELMNKDRVV